MNLLHIREPKHKSSIALIDFDHAEVYTSKKRVTDTVVSFISFSIFLRVKKGQGTPTFMARAIKKGGPLEKPDTFSPSPELRGDAASVYKRCYHDRFKLFGNGMKRPTRVAVEAVLPPFRHEIRHDAESSVWVFLWWIVLAAPQGKELVGNDEILWRYISLDGPMKNHQRLLSMLQQDLFRSDFVHPEYQQVLPLITSMAILIETDNHWVKEEKYKHPEYLHGALQRVILCVG